MAEGGSTETNIIDLAVEQKKAQQQANNDTAEDEVQNEIVQEVSEMNLSSSESASISVMKQESTSSDQGLTLEPLNFERGKLIGRGKFGDVYFARNRTTKESCAVKIVRIPRGGIEPKEEIKSLRNEIDLLRQLSHKHIVQYCGAAEECDLLCLYMEYMPAGSVRDEIVKHGALKEHVACKYTRQIIEALVYLHSKKILHRDIKCANILQDLAENIKLADFGISKHVETIISATGTSATGTPHWMSPEVVKGEKYGERADIWSVGITVYEMLTGNPPWHELDSMQAIFKIGSKEPKRDLPHNIKVSENCRNFLRDIFVKKTKRPFTTEILLHKWLIEKQYGKQRGEKLLFEEAASYFEQRTAEERKKFGLIDWLRITECYAELGKDKEAEKTIQELIRHLMTSSSDVDDVIKYAGELILDKCYFRALVLFRISNDMYARNSSSPDDIVQGIYKCARKMHFDVIKHMIESGGRLKVFALKYGRTFMSEMIDTLRAVENADPAIKGVNEAYCVGWIGYNYYSAKEYEKSIEFFKSGVDAMERQFDKNASKYQIYGHLLNGLGYTNGDLGRYSIAVEYYTKAIDSYNNASDYSNEDEKETRIETTQNNLKITRAKMK